MSNPNLKGRATAAFTVEYEVTDEVLTITVTADVEGHEDYIGEIATANGTVALGKQVAEFGKIATPVTASERKLAAQVEMYIDSGLTEAQAIVLAAQVNSL